MRGPFARAWGCLIAGTIVLLAAAALVLLAVAA